MKPSEIELRVLQLLDRVRDGLPIESSLVELKAGWIDPKKAARQLGGLANASHGEPILWIIGVAENSKEVTGASEKELSTWWSQVQSHFDGLSPDLILNLPVPYGDRDQNRVVVALLFDTVRLPFVVTRSGEREVPWREGNSTRSARREDLIRLLAPALRVPTIEVLHSKMYLTGGTRPDKSKVWWGQLDIVLYVTEPPPSPIVIPFHRCELRISIDGWLSDKEVHGTLAPPQVVDREEGEGFHKSTYYRADSYTIEGTGFEIIIKGPGRIELEAKVPDMDPPSGEVGGAVSRLRLRPSATEYEATLESSMRLVGKTDRAFTWDSSTQSSGASVSE